MPRVQTLGLGGTDNEEVIGLLERQWTIESGPMIGWRRLPVHLSLKTYWELLDRHDGYTAELAFLLPREFSWGYIVPSVEFRYLSEDYANYYYGVQPAESTLARPIYSPGSVINPYVAVRTGYRFNDRWMITGRLGLEFLDSAVQESPIVDKDQIWSATIGVAYNTSLFQRRSFDASTGSPRALEFRIGIFSNTLESTVRRYDEEGRPGDEVTIESVLGVPDRDSTLQADLILRFGFYHRMELSYFEFGRNSSAVLDRDITIGDETFVAGSTVDTSQDTQTLQLVYGYSLMRDAQKELGLSAGLHYSSVDLLLLGRETRQRVQLQTEVPLPTIGAFGSVTLANRWSVQAEARAFALELDRYEGTMGYFAVRLERGFGQNFAAGIGFNYYSSRLESRDAELRGVYKSTRYGPLVYLGMQF